eukprot:gene10523-7492_t
MKDGRSEILSRKPSHAIFSNRPALLPAESNKITSVSSQPISNRIPNRTVTDFGATPRPVCHGGQITPNLWIITLSPTADFHSRRTPGELGRKQYQVHATDGHPSLLSLQLALEDVAQPVPQTATSCILCFDGPTLLPKLGLLGTGQTGTMGPPASRQDPPSCTSATAYRDYYFVDLPVYHPPLILTGGRPRIPPDIPLYPVVPLPMFPPAAPVSPVPPRFCHHRAQHLVLVKLYRLTNGRNWIRYDGWLWGSYSYNEELSQVQYNCTKIQGGKEYTGLPWHCCWFGVSCCLEKLCETNPETNRGSSSGGTPGNDSMPIPGEPLVHLDPALCDVQYSYCVPSLDCGWQQLISGRFPLPVRQSHNGNDYYGIRCSLLAPFVLYPALATRLNGSLPGDLQSMQKLEVLGMGNNRFTGKVPGNFSNMNSLVVLDVSNNLLTGDLPVFCKTSQGKLSDREGVTNLQLGGNFLSRMARFPNEGAGAMFLRR